MSKRRHVLDEISRNDRAIIIEIIPKTETNKQPRVLFNCFCGKEYSKQINDVCGKKSTGLLCYEHSLERKRRVVLRTAIRESSLRHGASYTEEGIVWGKDSCITFKCFCGIENTKTLWAIRKNQGMFCKIHTSEKTREKTKNTSNLNYGTDHPQQSLEIKERNKKNCMKKYGVEYLAHVPEINDKQHNFKFKNYAMPSGEIRKIQGYENLALDELIKNYAENIITTKRFGIKYMFQEKIHYYYPDIILEIEPRKIIEVKSHHTMYYKHNYLKNLAKKRGCIEQNYDFDNPPKNASAKSSFFGCFSINVLSSCVGTSFSACIIPVFLRPL